MKAFLRENPTIAFGLGLPLLLVILFLLVSGIPALLVEDPKYDVLYTTGYQDHRYGLQVSVIDQKVEVIHQGPVRSNRKPRLWWYNARTGGVKEIVIKYPPDLQRAGRNSPSSEELAKVTVIKVPELEDLKVDASSVAPDGYEFVAGGRYSRNVFDGLFFGSRYRYQAVLTRDARKVRLPVLEDNYYGRNVRFIGWVLSQ